MSRTRYGDLLDDAARSITDAGARLHRERFGDRARAGQAIAVYRDLLHALGRHGWQLFGSDRTITGISASGAADPADEAAARLVDELATIARRLPEDQPLKVGSVAAAWRSAARSVRTASDLLATHRGPAGEWRSPQASLLDDPAVRAVGFAELTALVAPVAEAARHLELRAGQAGLTWQTVDRLVPATAAVVAAATAVRDRGAPTAGTPLATVEVARPAVSTDTPATELADRLARLRQAAWQLTREPHVGIATLADFAAAGVLVTTRAATRYRDQLVGDGDGPASVPALATIAQAAMAWRTIHQQARQLRTATPGSRAVRAEVYAIRRLLEPPPSGEGPDGPGPHEFRQVLIRACQALPDIAAWNSHVLSRLSSTGQVYLPGSSLDGNAITDDRVLVEAKLHHRLVPAPGDRASELLRQYRMAGATGSAKPQHVWSPSYSRPPAAPDL